MSDKMLDDVDRQIIDHLSKDARLSNREIADALGLVEGTVRGRIKRLQSENIIKIMAIADTRVMTGHENPMMAYLGIHANLDTLRETAETIAELSFVRFAATMLGRYEILAISFFGSNDEMIECVNRDIMSIAGVKHVDTKLAIKNVKYDYRWGRIIKSKN
jgi:DNA-binding Lrp family transcriptional regulator